MGELNLNGENIINELVGIVGMLSNREGSTVKDIASVLESLHGPVRQDVIQEGLRSAVSSGVLVCKHRRYKVCKQRSIFGSESFFDLERSSNRIGGRSTEIDLRDDEFSVSTISAEVDQYLEADTSCPASEYYSVEEIMSVRSIPSSDQLSTGSYLYDQSCEGSSINSKPKQRKRKAKKPLTTVENDTGVAKAADKLEDCQQEISRDVQTQETMVNTTEENMGSGKNKEKHLSVKRSMTDVMNEVMKQLTEYNKPNDSVHCDKKVVDREESRQANKDSSSVMSKVMTEVMKKVNHVEQPEHMKASETSSTDVEKSGSVVKSIGGAITEVMKRITGGEVQRNTSPVVPGNEGTSVSTDDEPTIKTANRSVGTGSQDIVPSCSNYKIPKSVKREKKVKQQNESSDVDDGVRYLTRSRAKANELRRSRMQSPSNSDTSSKKARFS